MEDFYFLATLVLGITTIAINLAIIIRDKFF